MDKVKYLVPYDITVSQFITVIRKRLSLKPEVALMVSIEDGIVPSSISSIGDLYNAHKYADGFLYFQYYQENTFGSTSTFEKV
jgi:GABA(A) receptor-associated protein